MLFWCECQKGTNNSSERVHMLIDIESGDILESRYKHIAFEMHNGRSPLGLRGFAEAVASYLPEQDRWNLTNGTLGRHRLGTVVALPAKHKNFHALICYSLETQYMRRVAPIITKCLDGLAVPETEIIAVAHMNGGDPGESPDKEERRKGLLNSEFITALIRSRRKVVLFPNAT